MPISNDDDGRLLVGAALIERDDDRRGELVWKLAGRGRASRVATIKDLLSGDEPSRVLGADIIGATPYFKTAEDRKWAREQRLPAADIEPFTPADRAWLAEVMMQFLDSSQDAEFVYSMIRAAGAQGVLEAAESVARHAADEDEDVREATAAALGSLRGEGPLPESATQALLQLARDPADAVRSWALFALGRSTGIPVDTPDARATFTENANHPDDDVRGEAIRALALLGHVESLEKALNSYDFDEELIEAARRVGNPRLHAPLGKLLAKETASDQDPETGQHVEAVLRRAMTACRSPDLDS